MKQVIFLTSCAILTFVPLLFVINRVYQDGIFGRLGLLGISFASSTYLIEKVLVGTRYDVLPQTAAFFAFVAVFLCWHLFRFHVRVLRISRQEERAANDGQQQVIFKTLADVCSHRGSREITVRLCRSPEHEAANTGVAVCAEPVCPILKEKRK